MLAAAGVVGLAAARTSAQERLDAVKQLSCVFPTSASGTWSKDEPRASVRAAALSLRFDSIDTAGGTARVTDGFGYIHITARLSGGVLHFVQVFKTGPLYVTSVFPSESRHGKLKAVHSRHELTEAVLPGFTSNPEQYYGECETGP